MKAKLLHAADIAGAIVRFIPSPRTEQAQECWTDATLAQFAETWPFCCVDDLLSAFSIPDWFRASFVPVAKDRVTVTVGDSVATFVSHDVAVGLILAAIDRGYAPTGTHEAYVTGIRAAYIKTREAAR